MLALRENELSFLKNIEDQQDKIAALEDMKLNFSKILDDQEKEIRASRNAPCKKCQSTNYPGFIKSVFEANLTTLELMGHKNAAIFRTDFNPEKMVTLVNEDLHVRLTNIIDLVRDHFMQLIEDVENTTRPGKDAALTEYFKAQMLGSTDNPKHYLVVKSQGEMVQNVQTAFVYNEKMKAHINV